ncbi:dTMP kinase [Candidatus Azambacteria bacterium]|nr:dTMP kinase [Candidatus Azambacteria bacterium]MBI3685210.1 dTMP kinase [Candidatus Azambacteria bacterium]
MSIFIVIEGIECAGKTTQIKKVASALEAKGHKTVTMREPGSSQIGEQIRTILKDPSHKESMDPLTSLFLFNAARRQFVKEIVKPALKRGEVVLSDRFFLSTIAYQGYAEGADKEFVRSVCAKTVEGCMPKKTFLLDIGIQEMKKRLLARGGMEHDRYDQMDISFHEKVREGYLTEWEKNKSLIERINGERSEEEITQDILQRILLLLS